MISLPKVTEADSVLNKSKPPELKLNVVSNESRLTTFSDVDLPLTLASITTLYLVAPPLKSSVSNLVELVSLLYPSNPVISVSDSSITVLGISAL